MSGHPKNRWEDDVKSNITKMEITNWKECIRNRTKWKKLVEKAKTSLKLQCLKKKKKPFVKKRKADKRTSYHTDYIPDEQGVFNYEWT